MRVGKDGMEGGRGGILRVTTTDKGVKKKKNVAHTLVTERCKKEPARTHQLCRQYSQGRSVLTSPKPRD